MSEIKILLPICNDVVSLPPMPASLGGLDAEKQTAENS